MGGKGKDGGEWQGGMGGEEEWEKVVDGVKGVLIYEQGVDFPKWTTLLVLSLQLAVV